MLQNLYHGIFDLDLYYNITESRDFKVRQSGESRRKKQNIADIP